MPVTLDMKAPATPKGAPSPVQEAIGSCLLPQDKQMGFVALGVWLALLAFLCGIWWLSEATLPFAYGMPVWCLVAIVAYLVFGPKYLSGKLRGLGSSAQVSSSNKPLLKNMLAKAAPVLAMREPRVFLPDQPAPRSRVWPQAVLFNKPIWNVMDDSEASVLLIHGLAHQKLGHARRLALLDLLDQTPTVTRFLVWPVLLYARFLRHFWLPHALKSADRLALLLVRNPSLLMNAILKEYAANDAQMQAMNVSSEDVTNWISQKGHIGMKGEEISTQYKLGRAIHESPLLEDRIHEMQRWCSTPEFKEAVEKLASVKR